MSNKKKEEKELVYIEWGDALYTSDWIARGRIKEWAETSDWIVKHVGWIIEENPRYIVIASRLSEKTNKGDDEFGAVQKIPKTWIKIRKKLR